MKTINLIFTITVLLIATTGNASDTPKMKIVQGDENDLTVSFESATRCPVELTITGDDGAMVYYWQSESMEDAVNHKIDLKELGNGTFNVSLNYGCRSINRVLNVSRKEIKVGQPYQRLEPLFSFKEDKLNVSFLNVANKNVYLNIYKDGEHYDGFTLGKDCDIQKCFDFSKAEKGSYEIVLTDYFKEHYYTVNK